MAMFLFICKFRYVIYALVDGAMTSDGSLVCVAQDSLPFPKYRVEFELYGFYIMLFLGTLLTHFNVSLVID